MTTLIYVLFMATYWSLLAWGLLALAVRSRAWERSMKITVCLLTPAVFLLGIFVLEVALASGSIVWPVVWVGFWLYVAVLLVGPLSGEKGRIWRALLLLGALFCLWKQDGSDLRLYAFEGHLLRLASAHDAAGLESALSGMRLEYYMPDKLWEAALAAPLTRETAETARALIRHQNSDPDKAKSFEADLYKALPDMPPGPGRLEMARVFMENDNVFYFCCRVASVHQDFQRQGDVEGTKLMRSYLDDPLALLAKHRAMESLYAVLDDGELPDGRHADGAPLREACTRGFADVIELLQERGADISLIGGEEGCLALMPEAKKSPRQLPDGGE